MLNLQTAIKDIDHKIESMYEEENLKQLEYELHAVMVHEGGVDSGHYWAYVKDHKKQVGYLKIILDKYTSTSCITTIKRIMNF